MEEMVKATVIVDEFDVTAATLYRMADKERIPAHQVGGPHLKRKQWRFRRSEVATVLRRRTEVAAALEGLRRE